MEVFLTLILKIIPLYVTILLGWIAGKALNLSGHNIAALLFYIIVPTVYFSGATKIPLSKDVLFLPILTFLVGTCLCLIFLKVGKKLLKDSRANVLALMSGTGNTGYFGIPVAAILFDDATLGIYITSLIGITLFQSSVGFYVTARGNHTASECLWKIVKLPTLYTFCLGLGFNVADIEIPSVFDNFFDSMFGSLTILGMMIIGMGIARIKEFSIDFSFITAAFLVRFLVWPLVMFSIIAVDKNFFFFFSENIYKILILLSIVPLAADTVTIATLLKAHPEQVATAVLASTLFALVYMPIMIILFL